MKFFGVHIEDLESDRFLSASNDQVATWLFLHALCCKLLNHGIIPDAAKLPSRFWGRHGIDVGILEKPSPLWTWQGDALHVEPYDIDGQAVYERKVQGGKNRAAQRWGGGENRSPNRSPISTPHSSCNAPNPTQPEITQENPTKKSDVNMSSLADLFPSEKRPKPSKQDVTSKAEEIYKKYPRQEARKKAIDAILKAMQKHDPAMLLEKVTEYATAITWKQKQFIPLAATWFNDERFHDDPNEWKNPEKSRVASSEAMNEALRSLGRRGANITDEIA